MTNVACPETTLRETENEYLMELAVPGAGKENLEIEIADNILTVKAHPDLETGDRRRIGEAYFPAEYRRRFKLGGDIDTDKISAEAHNGIIMITMPKKPEPEPRKVDVK